MSKRTFANAKLGTSAWSSTTRRNVLYRWLGAPAGATGYFNFREGRLPVNVITATRLSAATYFTPAANLANAASSVPRFDTNPITLAPRGLLTEPASTNLLTHSNAFDNATGWPTLNLLTVTPTSGTAPTGINEAYKLAEAAGTNSHGMNSNSFSVTNTVVYTASAYFKAAERTSVQIIFASLGFGANAWANFNLSTGALGTVGAAATARITALPNGWYRCEATATATASVSVTLGIALITSPTAVRAESYTGVVGNGVLAFGAQFEAAGAASSYIATSGTSATRAADVANITNLASLGFNAAEGTLVMEFERPSASTARGLLALSDNTANNVISLRSDNTTASTLVMDVVTGGVAQASLSLTGLGTGARYKVAMAYRLNDFAYCANGGAVQTDTLGTVPTVTRLTIGNSPIAGVTQGSIWTGVLTYYPIRLTNAQLQALTV